MIERPRKIILSRKGFDSAYGGQPSPILDGRKLVPMPIPGRATPAGTEICYQDIRLPDDCRLPAGSGRFAGNAATYYDLMYGLYAQGLCRDGQRLPLKAQSICHLDPDLSQQALPRQPGWKPLFGQEGAALTHLQDQGVGPGDIFLFFGWFAEAECPLTDNRYRLRRGRNRDQHLIFGYFTIGQIHRPVDNWQTLPEWARYHPHVTGDDYGDNNAVFEAADFFPASDRPGAGFFQAYDRSLVLTRPGQTRSRWALPDCFRNTRITYHSDKSWVAGAEPYFQSAMIGQEFVVDCTDAVWQWTRQLVLNNH